MHVDGGVTSAYVQHLVQLRSCGRRSPPVSCTQWPILFKAPALLRYNECNAANALSMAALYVNTDQLLLLPHFSPTLPLRPLASSCALTSRSPGCCCRAQIEVALWMLWVHATRQADHLWVDQFCVPQDVDIDTKMGHVRESPSIYSSGAVFVILAPVVSYATGRILTMAAARELAAPHLQRAGVGYSMEDSALKALLINNSYFRRVWTIQEAVAAQSLSMWPLLGSGNTVDSYQSLWVLDWPQFNKWGEARYSGTLRDTSAANGSVQAYLDGDYTGLLGVLGSGAPEGIQYLSMAARQAMWATLDRAGLVNEIKTAPSPAQRAFVVLNKHQVSQHVTVCD